MKYYTKVFSLILIATILFLVGISLFYEHSNDVIKGDKLSKFSDVSDVEWVNSNTYQVYITLNEDFSHRKSILFRTEHLKVKVFLEDEQLYSFGYTDNSVKFLKSPGKIWNLASIPANSQDKVVKLVFETVYDNYDGYLPDIGYGTKGDCVATYQRSSIFSLFGIFLVLIVGLGAYLIYFLAENRKSITSKTFLHLGTFAVSIFIWILCQDGALQIYFGYPQVLYLLEYVGLFIFPIPINFLVYYLLENPKKRLLYIFPWVHIGVLLVSFLIQVFTPLDLFQIQFIAHGATIANVLVFLYLVYKEYRLNKVKTLRSFLIPLNILIIGGISELFYLYLTQKRASLFIFKYTVIIFMIVVIVDMVKRFYQNLLRMQEDMYLKILAYKDLLTDLPNRNEFEEDIKKIKNKLPIGAMMFDLNMLKFINDNYGHDKGDEALKACASFIKEVFSPKGKSYRIGGDEFCMLLNEKLEDSEIKAFTSLVADHAQKSIYPFSIAFGVAYYDKEKDKTVYDLIKKADNQMYVMKKEQKEERSLSL